nr:uncharacterized protein LOC128680584 [Plodia interpunctella]
MAAVYSTPVNTITRETLSVLISNNVMNESIEFASDCEMDTNSPLRKPNLRPVIKKLFHSPLAESNQVAFSRSNTERSRKARKRKQNLIPDSGESIKKAYVIECERDTYSPDVHGGMRKRVLISLFHNKEYSMDVDLGS